MPVLISKLEFARRMGVTSSTIDRWVREGRVEATRYPSGRPMFRWPHPGFEDFDGVEVER